MPIKLILALAIAAVLGGCATQPQTRIVQLNAEFDETAARELIEKGENTLTGYAYVNRGDGGFVTCAGELVELVPATDYAAERMSHIYGPDEAGASSSGQFVFEPDPREYAIVRRATNCDDQGTFKFEGVADGTFYVITGVWWQEADRLLGANLMRRVRIGDEAAKEAPKEEQKEERKDQDENETEEPEKEGEPKGETRDVILTRTTPSTLDRTLDLIRQIRPTTSSETE